MRVVIVGAYGLIGGAVTARLLADGRQVVGVGRDVRVAARRLPQVEWRRADVGRMAAGDWAPLLAGVDAVVDCAGALQDGPSDDLEAVHVAGVEALAPACVAAGVRRFVLISAAGVGRGGSAFSATKRRGEAALASFDLDWVVLRPGLVLGPAAYGGSALLRGLAAFPLVVPAVFADRAAQVTSIDDVAEAVARSIQPDGPAKVACDVVAPQSTTLAEVLTELRAWLGITPAPVVALPPVFGRAAGLAADALAWLGWRSPLRSTTLAQLAAGVTGKASDATRMLGFRPKTLAELLAAHPAGVQDRWFARLYLLKPVMIATLAAFWIASGAIGLVRIEDAAAVLTAGGLQTSPAHAAVLAGGGLDVALGAAALARPTARFALRGMIAVSMLYLAGASLWRPDLWADPLGPLIKVIPAMILAMAALATMDDR